MLYGARSNEMPLPPLGPIKRKARITSRPSDPAFRPALAVSLGCHVQCGTNPITLVKVDPSDTRTVVEGNHKRMLFRPPTPEALLLGKFKIFVGKWLRDHLIPLPGDTDLSVDSWLEGTDYPLWRKEQLKKKWERVQQIKSKKYTRCKSFGKDEFYMTYKHLRAINSRTDEFKCLVGPTFSAIEKSVFRDPVVGKWFIKKVPVKDRPNYIFDRLYKEGAQYLATDYTSFEAQFTKDIMDACEFQLYDYMAQSLPNKDEFHWAVHDVLGGTNVCTFKNVTVSVPATRMSGEMCTSLGNGFSNLMFALFVSQECGCTDVVGVVEGDDGLFTMQAPKNAHLPREEDFARLGLVIKPEWHDDISTASFCGIVFAPEDRNNLSDPFKQLLSFGWTAKRYCRAKTSKLMQLLRAKALSLAYQYPGCPIAQELGQYGLRVTRGVNISEKVLATMGTWERGRLLEAMKYGYEIKPIGWDSRRLVEKLWRIAPMHQIAFEQRLEKLNTIKPLWGDELLPYLKDEWIDFGKMYSGHATSSSLDHPCPIWAPLRTKRPA